MSGQVVVFLGTRLAVLEHRDTRWGAVLREWAAKHGDEVRLHVVDFPRFSRRPRVPIVSQPSWLPKTLAWDVTLPLTGPERHAHEAVVERLVARALVRALRLTQADALVAATPLWVPTLASTGLQWSFDAVDDWRSLPASSAYPRRVAHGYAQLRHASALTTVSEDLSARLQHLTGGAAVVVPNGVDVERLGAPMPPPDGVPRRPFAVYVGHLRSLDRLSLDHVAATVGAGIPVVTAGDATSGVRAALSSAGVHHLGEVSRSELPGLLQAATVGLVPHLDTPLTRSMDAMKTLEYLAAGLPVVVTPVAARPEYADRVVVADRAEDFAAAVAAAAVMERGLPHKPLRTWTDVARDLWRSHVAADHVASPLDRSQR